MPITPETEEAPADHPIHRGLIYFVRRPQPASKSPVPQFPKPDLSEEEIARLRKLLEETVKLKPLF